MFATRQPPVELPSRVKTVNELAATTTAATTGDRSGAAPGTHGPRGEANIALQINISVSERNHIVDRLVEISSGPGRLQPLAVALPALLWRQWNGNAAVAVGCQKTGKKVR